jgi:hypothetical protein
MQWRWELTHFSANSAEINFIFSVPKVADMEDEDSLPANLQEMVMQALEDIRREAHVAEA